jgi:hypothetical protein
MFSWLANLILNRNMARLREGDYRPLLRSDAKNVRFRFPGDSSFAADLVGKDALEEWLKRFVDVGLQIYPDEVILPVSRRLAVTEIALFFSKACHGGRRSASVEPSSSTSTADVSTTTATCSGDTCAGDW